MYKHSDTSVEHITLHDCRANKAAYKDGVLSFWYEDGFWVCPGHDKNDCGKTVRTDASKVKFHLANEGTEDVRIYIFTKKKRKTIRKEWTLKKFVKAINAGDFTVEFLYCYKGYNIQVHDCWIWFDKAPYNKECELRIYTDEVTYLWNELREDRAW